MSDLMIDRETLAAAMIAESHARYRHFKGSGPGIDEFTINNMNERFYHVIGALDRLGFEVVKKGEPSA